MPSSVPSWPGWSRSSPGQGFANNLTQYDDLSAGARFSESDLHPFSVQVQNFDVRFETGPVQTGAARLFRADVQVTDAPGEAPHAETLEVNKPLDVDGTAVHLIGHGYAPKVTIKDANGDVAFSGPVVFLPQDGNCSSAGAIKAPDGRPERLAFEGLFFPTAVLDSATGPSSAFPDALDPALFLNAWTGPPKVETGRSENVYSLDTVGLTQLKGEDGQPYRFALRTGQTVTLPDGKGTITMDGSARWVKLQVGETPGVPIALALAVLGLCLSLFVRPRRVWVRVSGDGEGPRLLEVGVLDRADARGGPTEDVAELADELSGASPPAPGASCDPPRAESSSAAPSVRKQGT